MSGEPQGCLGIILKLFGFSGGSDESEPVSLPYRQRDHFLSAAELSFFHVLNQVTASHFHVCTKVRISDLLYVVNRRENLGHANRIDRKHVDFVLCNPKTMQPILVVELDDASHQRRDRQERDALVDAAFLAADLPILHVPCRSNYDPENLKQQIRSVLSLTATATLPPTPPAISENVVEASSVPQCPKCNITMVERVASRGSKKGKRFWACPSYPDCRKIVAID